VPLNLFNLLAQSSLAGVGHVNTTHLQGDRLLVTVYQQPIGVLFSLSPSAHRPAFSGVDLRQRDRFSGVLRNPVEVEAVGAGTRVLGPIQRSPLPPIVNHNFQAHAGKVIVPGKPNRRFVRAIRAGSGGKTWVHLKEPVQIHIHAA
jgi:hypothetical protein